MKPTPAQIEAVIDEFKDELTSGQRRLIVNEICRLTAAAEVDMATGDIPKGYKGKWTSTQAQIEAAAPIGPDFMPDAPHDGTPVRAWGKWMPAEGVVLRWKDQVGWCGDQGLACFKTVDRWEAAAEVGEPLPSTNWKDGKPYNYCPECGRDDRFLDAATIERCAQVAQIGYGPIGENIAAAIRELKDKP